jgi:small-conductance mechanosensitive channel
MEKSQLWPSLASTGLIIVFAASGLVFVQFLAKRAQRAVRSLPHVREARRQQMVTVVQIAHWGASLLIVGSAVLMLLSALGVNIAPLLASAGVAGLAISLGAQTLIKDLIGGFLILVENQYAVGDAITVNAVSGTVERLTLRATYVRDINGNLYVVPNGDVRIVGNQTKEWSRALVDVSVASEEDLDRVTEILQGVTQAFAQDADFGPQLLESPQILGPLSTVEWAVTIRVMVKTQPGKQWRVSTELRRRLSGALAREGVATPYPRQEIWVRGPAQGDTQLDGS